VTRLLLYEAKRCLPEYKKMLFFLAAAAVFCAVLAHGVRVVIERGAPLEKFTVGVVDNDRSPEFQILLDFFYEHADLAPLAEDEARALLAAGEIPAYAVFPAGFSSNIITGANRPFYLYGDPNKPLAVSAAKLLTTAASAFLSASQAGIYAAMDFAEVSGMKRGEVMDALLYPVNVAFIKQLLAYENFFDSRVQSVTDGSLPPAVNYGVLFASFWLVAVQAAFVSSYRGYNRAVMARLKIAGVSGVKVQLIRLYGSAVFMVPAVLAAVCAAGILGFNEMTAAVFFGAAAYAVCAGAYGLTAASVFKSDGAAGIFIFVTSFFMLFTSGGLVPVSFLPQSVRRLAPFSLHYWAAEAYAGNIFSVAVLFSCAAIFFGVICFASVFFTGKGEA